jgi:hypothetical protein
MVAAFASATKQRGRPAGGWARYMRVAATLLLCVTLVMWAKPGDASISSKPVPQQPKSIILLESPTHPDATPTSSVDGGQSGDALQASSGGSGEREEGEDEGVNGGGENSSTGEGGGSNPGGGGSPGRGGSKAPRKVRVGWMSNVFHDRPLSGLSIHEAVRVASDNTGNMVLAYGAWQLLDHQRVEVVHVAPPPYKIDVAAVLIPTANLLFDRLKYSGSQMVGMTNMMLNITRSNRVPSALLGIGSQVEFTQPLAGEEGAAARAKRPTADFSAADKVQLPPTQVALLQRVVDSGGFISTRGAFTARILEANGLPPPLPLGCPSLFLNHNPALGAELQRKWNAVLAERSTSLRLAVTLPAISHRTDMPPYVDMLAVRVLKRFPNSMVVLQTEADAFSLERLHAKHDVYVPVDRVRYFYDPRSWVEGLAACCDFAFGFRWGRAPSVGVSEGAGLWVGGGARSYWGGPGGGGGAEG